MTPKDAFERCFRENKRIQKLEKIISNDPYYAYEYAVKIICKPWEEGEKSISTDPGWSYCYARDVIDGRWEKGERVISKDSECSFLYARDVIEEPFEKCHPIIFNSEYKEKYIDFLKSINYDLNKISEWLI